LERIDWPCEVKTLFHEENLGCIVAPRSAINWFFKEIEEGIILEDDCLPDLSFFNFCEELIEKYRGNERVMMISGDNFQTMKRGVGSYFFSRYVHCWGWATWRRAWQNFDYSISKWSDYRERRELLCFMNRSAARRAQQMFNGNFNEKNTSHWDVQWFFTCLVNQGLCIFPEVNLVSNIGSAGTHMKVYDPHVNRPSGVMRFPLRHPQKIWPDADADKYAQYYYFYGWRRALFLIANYLLHVLKKTPLRLPGAMKNVCTDVFREILARWHQ
jgi:hypothetical protein